MKIAVSYTIDVPDESLLALTMLAAVEPDDLAGARRFVQAEAEQTTVDYLTDNGVTVVPIRGVAFDPDDYGTGDTAPEESGNG